LIAAQFLCGLSEGLHQILGIGFGSVRHLEIYAIGLESIINLPTDRLFSTNGSIFRMHLKMADYESVIADGRFRPMSGHDADCHRKDRL
jgi:hypothetical protein